MRRDIHSVHGLGPQRPGLCFILSVRLAGDRSPKRLKLIPRLPETPGPHQSLLCLPRQRRRPIPQRAALALGEIDEALTIDLVTSIWCARRTNHRAA